jgi:hypothetical protein
VAIVGTEPEVFWIRRYGRQPGVFFCRKWFLKIIQIFVFLGSKTSVFITQKKRQQTSTPQEVSECNKYKLLTFQNHPYNSARVITTHSTRSHARHVVNLIQTGSCLLRDIRKGLHIGLLLAPYDEQSQCCSHFEITEHSYLKNVTSGDPPLATFRKSWWRTEYHRVYSKHRTDDFYKQNHKK